MGRVSAPANTPRFAISVLKKLLLVPLLLLFAVPAQGQSPSDRIHRFLESASGFQLLETIHTAVLDSGKAITFSVTLLEGAEYMVVGYCDEACTNIDLTLLDPSGEEIQADRLPDAEPILMLAAETTGEYFIQAQAIECSVTGCNIALGILGSTAEPGVGPGEDMAGRLSLVGAEFGSFGFTEVGHVRRGSLNTDQSISLPVPFEEGMEYRIAGVCDKDCFDLDLVLRDPQGTEVDSDLLVDALPILAHVADTTGDYQMDVAMVACGVEPCAFRIVTYARSGGGAPGGMTFSGELMFQETHSGKLGPEDETLPTGQYLDVYEIEAEAGQRIIVDLRSDEFDTLLRLMAPDGVGEENDDYGEELGHSHIEMLTLMDGVYSIQATTFGTEMSGNYTLQIAVVR